ncbi:MAG: UDP-N-acetylglucosamine 2-epimerase (non-hydrolyzing) [Anaerolineales bacterium]|nr:UDP-N-acetylglucosamine 2-epimerase (non-hydrolyzing) [Anaerolineales bacterium]
MIHKPVIHLVAAARPNFMKVAPLYHELIRQDWCKPLLVHTGQHYDENMSENILRDLGLPEPDIHLGIGSGTHAEQTAGVMIAYEKVCLQEPPAFVVVVGDVNATMAVAITAKKLLLPLAHLEAGLRSRDRSMPEEINRIVTDNLSDLLWTPSPDADDNLLAEGIPQEYILRVGNIMIDSYEMLRDKIEAEPVMGALKLSPRSYAVVTLHRPANVDQQETLRPLCDALRQIALQLPLVFPVHPRTRKQLQAFNLWDSLNAEINIHLLEPVSYIPFMALVQQARLVITDSGGIQEETTYLDIPCLTVRTTTERPITITQGTNRLVTTTELKGQVEKALSGQWVHGVRPELWDGRTAARVADSLRKTLGV